MITQGEVAYQQDGITLIQDDCRDVMAAMEPGSVSCCITSPPFWGLRRYECEPTIWGGDKRGCEHEWASEFRKGATDHWNQGGKVIPQTERKAAHGTGQTSECARCSRCSAWRGQFGLEPSVAMYVAHTMEVLGHIWRVLRKDGVLWWDIDDSRGGSANSGGVNQTQWPIYRPQGLPIKAIAAKSLCLIPQRIAIAAQEAGWIVRSVIVIPTWMPESAKDRPTDAYRTVLMLCKSRSYFYDGYAVRVTGGDGWHNSSFTDARDLAVHPTTGVGDRLQLAGRNLASIWDDIPPSNHPHSDRFKHFATFPLAEPERCIKASCPAEICVKCGKARERVVKRERGAPHDGRTASGYEDGSAAKRLSLARQAARERGSEYVDDAQTIGWTNCGCGAGWIPGLVLDPFAGTGTSLIAARKLGRRAIGIEISEEYVRQAVTRLTIGDSGVRTLVNANRHDAHQLTLE